MHMIVGHTTHDSAWIWVRGRRDVRRVEVEVRRAACSSCGEQDFKNQKPHFWTRPAQAKSFLPELSCANANCGKVENAQKMKLCLKAKNDFTAVARFNGVLDANTTYRVFLRSPKIDCTVEGRLRTFAPPGDSRPFQFLHGSCNLPVARLTALGGLALVFIGNMAARSSLHRPASRWHLRSLAWPPLNYLVAGILRFFGRLAVGGYFLTISKLTRFEQPQPDESTKIPQMPSPFETLAVELDGFDFEEDKFRPDREKEHFAPEDYAERPAFMMHAGDQVYFDIDFDWRLRSGRGFARTPSQKNYRSNYRQAWFEDRATTRFLRLLPQYMILDDHEVVDGFGNGDHIDEAKHRRPALDAYDEYVSSRQPQAFSGKFEPPRARHKGYSFEYGDTGFFVLDTRTNRSPKDGLFIAKEQESELKRWLRGRSSLSGLQAPFRGL